MKEISGTVNVPIPIEMGKVSLANSYVGVAEQLLGSVTPLASADLRQTAWGLALIAGQIVENSLKAYLSRRGVPRDELIGTGHKLLKLWSDAVDLGFVYPQPTWLQRLSELLGPPYVLRYAENINGASLLPGQAVASDLPPLVSAVRDAMR
jgi:hypothetical protein